MDEAQLSKHIKKFQSNNALEYTQHAFQAILHSYGTIHHLTCPGPSQRNGRTEWKLRHILDTFRALILSAKVPTPFWGRGALHAINRIPSTIVQNQTPYKCFFDHLLTITTYAPLALPVSFFFSLMSTINLSLNPDFVVSLAMVKLKRGIGVMILSLIVFVPP